MPDRDLLTDWQRERRDPPLIRADRPVMWGWPILFAAIFWTIVGAIALAVTR